MSMKDRNRWWQATSNIAKVKFFLEMIDIRNGFNII